MSWFKDIEQASDESRRLMREQGMSEDEAIKVALQKIRQNRQEQPKGVATTTLTVIWTIGLIILIPFVLIAGCAQLMGH